MSASRWTPEQAWHWYHAQPWLVGCNFLPSSAINQLEMFQPVDYDRNRAVLSRELDWAAEMGMNTLRVFLHDLLWDHDADGFSKRIDDFLNLCAERGIKPMLVFFDACHRPEPKLGVQPVPVPGLHNPGWAQSPNVSVLMDSSKWGRLERYVKEVLRRYGSDERVLCWDLYNEPCNNGFDKNSEKSTQSAKLVTEVFGWAREAAPSQPLTICVWSAPHPLESHDLATLPQREQDLLASQKFAIENSDIISFHNYGKPENLRRAIEALRTLGRPLLCTEYMARTIGSVFSTALPILKEEAVAAYNWGFVSGKSQTIFPWGPAMDVPEPEVWFHDILRVDGSPYDASEPELIRKLTASEAETPVIGGGVEVEIATLGLVENPDATDVSQPRRPSAVPAEPAKE